MARILIVDDEENITKIVEEMLTIKGHQVVCAANGYEALKIIERQILDLVITDIIMPEMDGYELVLKLRKQQNSPKIIAMSGGSFNQDSAALLNNAHLMGANKILQKPFDSVTLHDAIIEVLGS